MPERQIAQQIRLGNWWIRVTRQRDLRRIERPANDNLDHDRLTARELDRVFTRNLQRRIQLTRVDERDRPALDDKPPPLVPVLPSIAQRDAVNHERLTAQIHANL